MFKFNLSVCGGTFDHFHKGHRAFLLKALSLTKHLLIGLSSDRFVKSKPLFYAIQNYEQREKILINFFRQNNIRDRISIEPINDLYIPKTWEKLPIEAIMVSKITSKGAESINIKRVKNNKNPLEIIVLPLIKNTDDKIISSFRIRKGEIDENGKPYFNKLWLKKSLILPEKLRPRLAKPSGVFIKDIALEKIKSGFSAAVGDATVKKFNDSGFTQVLSIVDLNVQRQKKFNNINELGFGENIKHFQVVNQRGSVSHQAFCLLVKLFRTAFISKSKSVVIQVDGEEDLLVLPLVIVAPLGFRIFYGQRNEGIIKVEVTEEKKKEVAEILYKMKMD